ncbi:hypothetical protein AB4Z54_75880, partial [Streptomyces sp. MCAF7]
VWGLLRPVQTEFPGRVVLVDTDTDDELTADAPPPTAEPQLALRSGRAFTPRLARGSVPAADPDGGPLDPAGTVLITGGTGGLGARLARGSVPAADPDGGPLDPAGTVLITGGTGGLG